MLCKCKYKFDGKKCNSNQKGNKVKCWFECKIQSNIICAEKLYLEFCCM